jgi:hypothetical protein
MVQLSGMAMDKIVKLSDAKTRSEAERAPDRQQMAEHVARVSFELSEIAARADMPLLKHLLDMSFEEAVQQGYCRSRRRTDIH